LIEEIRYLGVKGLIEVSKILPRNSIHKIAQIVVDMSYGKGSKREERIKRHLSFAFEESRVEAIYREYLWHKASLFAEIALMINGRFRYVDAVINLKEAKEKIEHLKSINRRGVVFLVSHYGNWEFLAQFFAINGFPGTLVAKEGRRDRLIYERIVQPYREAFGHRVIKREGAIRNIVKILHNREGVGIHIDQMIPPPNGVKVDFFDRKVFASKSMAELKLKFDPLMVPIFAKRVERERFQIVIEEPIEYVADEINRRDKAGRGDRVVKITQRYTDCLKSHILSSPPQWAWEYKRWRGA
jgi:KDO2-lipid IV(A) lauroyltransferase